MKKPSPHTHPCASRLLEDRDKTLPHLPCPDLATLGGAYDPYRHPAYEAMLTVADDVVKEYRSDWAHDLKMLARTDPSTPFVWFAYSSGTLLFTSAGVREAIMGGWKATFDLIPGDSPRAGRWFIWTGEQFREIGRASAALALSDWQQVLFAAVA